MNMKSKIYEYFRISNDLYERYNHSCLLFRGRFNCKSPRHSFAKKSPCGVVWLVITFCQFKARKILVNVSEMKRH